MSASHEVGAHRPKEEQEGSTNGRIAVLPTEPLAAPTEPLAAPTEPLAAPDFGGLLVPKAYQQQPWFPERLGAGQQITLWEAPRTNALPALIVSAISGSQLASATDRDSLFAACTLARHAVERHPWPSDDVTLVRPHFSAPDENGTIHVVDGIVVATIAAFHKPIGRDNDPAGRAVTARSIEILGDTRLDIPGTELDDPIISTKGKIRRRSVVERTVIGQRVDLVRRPGNTVDDQYLIVFRPGAYLWDCILEGDKGWWVDAGAYRELHEGRGLWLWLKGQLQHPARRANGKVDVTLRHLHDALGLHSSTTFSARRSVQRASEDIYSNVPGFLRGMPVFGRGMSGLIRFSIDLSSNHVASLEGKNRRLLSEAAARREAIDAGEIECRADDLVRMFLEVTGRDWDSIGDPIIQLRHAKLMLEDNFDYDEARRAVEAFAAHEWWGDKDFDLNTVRSHWGAVKGSGWYKARVAA